MTKFEAYSVLSQQIVLKTFLQDIEATGCPVTDHS